MIPVDKTAVLIVGKGVCFFKVGFFGARSLFFLVRRSVLFAGQKTRVNGLFPLCFFGEGRFFRLYIRGIIVCDHKRRIRHYLAGYPGSVHNNRIWKATKLFKESTLYFQNREYCIGDSAFENGKFMVSAFKKPKDRAIPAHHVKFNEKLAAMRIISEHCIGMLKGRFPWLRSIRLTITENKESLT